ncbi:MAG: FtsX-like permease family protein [Ruminococcus sp.]|nr:FtsX-like permease family protein [Ruminococcus sp.]
MYINILKRDLKRKKTMNIIIVIFIILAVTFVSSSVNNMSVVTSSLDNYFEKAGVADYITFEKGIAPDSKSPLEIAEKQPYVTYCKNEEILYIPSKITVEGKKITSTNSCVLCPIESSLQKYFDIDNNEIKKINRGDVYLRQSFLDDHKIKIGDKIKVPLGNVSKTFTVAGALKDASLGSMVMGIARFLINQNDYEKYKNQDNINEYKGDITFINVKNTADIDKLETALSECNTLVFNGSKDLLKTTYLMEMIIAGVLLIVSVCLIIISLIILRFTITFTLGNEFREIGIMKAIGIPNGKIRTIYTIKYFVMSIVGAIVGFAVSIPFGNIFLKETSKSILITSESFYILNFICAVAVVAVVMLFCRMSTAKVKKFTPVDAIRNGESGKRYKRKGLLKLSKLRIRPTVFMAVNDIISNLKRYAIMITTFTIGILLITITINTISTLQSGELINLLGIAPCDATIIEEDNFSLWNENGKQKLEDKLSDIKNTLAKNNIKADVFTETCYKFTIAKGSRSSNSLAFIGIGTTTDMYPLLEGSAPQNNDEVAITHIISDKIKAKIGDTVNVTTTHGKKEYLVTAIYQSMNNLGEGIRFYQDENFNMTEMTGMSDYEIRFCDNPSSAEAKSRIERIKELYPDKDVKSAGEYVDYLIGGVAEYFSGIRSMVLIVVLLINILVAVLMEKTSLTRERGETAMLKAVGFKNRSIIAWQVLRIFIVMVISTLLALALSDPVGQLSSGAIFRMMGAYNITFDVNVLESYIIYPLAVIVLTIFAVFITTLSILKIRSSEINSIE